MPCHTSHLLNSVYAYLFLILLLELTYWALGWPAFYLPACVVVWLIGARLTGVEFFT